MTVAALFVDPGGVYAQIPDVQTWGLPYADATTYAGPWPVVAHPPCARWGRLWYRDGSKSPGCDGGLFESAVASVRRWGGVLEHPASSMAFRRYGLGRPRRGAWQAADDGRGWIVEVDQGAYGHRARKPTWLYAVTPREPHPINTAPSGAVVPYADGTMPSAKTGQVQLLSKRERAATPLAFALLLLGIARGEQ